MKRYKITLTEKQIEAIVTVLFEYGRLEAESPEGRRLSAYYTTIIESIQKQQEKQDDQLWFCGSCEE